MTVEGERCSVAGFEDRGEGRRDAGASEVKGFARPPGRKPASTMTEAQGTELRLLASKRMLSSTTKSDDLLKQQ